MIIRFLCNVCGSVQDAPRETLERETPSCGCCGSSVRRRTIVYCLSLALFGKAIPLPDFPFRPHIRGIGLSDWEGYAVRLADKLDYRNTFYHQPPRVDICDPPAHMRNQMDFVISSDVFEHVLPPVDRAFEGVAEILNPGGIFVFTVPYVMHGEARGYYPDAHRIEVVKVDGRYAVVNLRRDGQFEVYPDPVFHGGPGATVEMRLLSRDRIFQCLDAAGFETTEVHNREVPDHGIFFADGNSLPIIARKVRRA